jgi:hypothetical protein
MQRPAALALAALLAPIGAALPAHAETYPINPGYWEVTTNWLGLVNTTERYCIEPRNITKFLAAPCNHIYHCNYPVQQLADGKANFSGTIRGHDELYYVSGGGTYSPTTVDMHVRGHGHWHIVPIPDARASVKGRYLAETCPAGAKRFK